VAGVRELIKIDTRILLAGLRIYGINPTVDYHMKLLREIGSSSITDLTFYNYDSEVSELLNANHDLRVAMRTNLCPTALLSQTWSIYVFPRLRLLRY
jgi:hypothetical protein